MNNNKSRRNQRERKKEIFIRLKIKNIQIEKEFNAYKRESRALSLRWSVK